ncbi:MAG TPA: DUF58 domain-containing protein [Aggregatilineales bacterium]|nr:DUF58 domain-containing protein [Aggregatilineales bacterium]
MVGYVPFLFLLLVAALILHVGFLYTAVYLLTAIYVLSRLWVGQMRINMRLTQHLNDRLFPGDKLNVEVTVKNEGWLPVPWVEIHHSFPTELTSPLPTEFFTLSSYAVYHQRFTFPVRRRGFYTIGPLDMRFGDVFGIVPRQRVREAVRSIIVYPIIVPIEKLGLPTRSPLAALPASTALFEDTSRVMGVRDYQPGDSPRQIHWSASAHSGTMLVKRYQPAIARETLICLDMRRDDYSRERYYDAIEMAITVAASIANHIIVDERQTAGLAVQAIDPLRDRRQVSQFYLPPRGERAALMHILDVLARIQSLDTPFLDNLHRDRLHLKFGATLVIVTGIETRELYDRLIPLVHAGVAIALVLVQPGGAPRLKVPPPRGVALYRILDTNALIL